MLGRLKEFLWFIRDLYRNRELISQLATNDFKTKYAGSMFGIIWDLSTNCYDTRLLVVFEVGFKNTPVDDVPFILWLICGLIPWFFFSEAWMSATNCLNEYRYLVKKSSSEKVFYRL